MLRDRKVWAGQQRDAMSAGQWEASPLSHVPLAGATGLDAHEQQGWVQLELGKGGSTPLVLRCSVWT